MVGLIPLDGQFDGRYCISIGIVWQNTLGTDRAHNLCAPWAKFGFLPLDVSTFLQQKKAGAGTPGS